MLGVAEAPTGPWQLRALVWVLVAESLLFAATTAFLVVEIFVAQAADARSALAITVASAFVAVAVGLLAYGVRRRWARIRGGIVTWQVLQLGAAFGAFQGMLEPRWLGFLLLVPGILGLWWVFAKPVTAVFAAADEASRRD